MRKIHEVITAASTNTEIKTKPKAPRSLALATETSFNVDTTCTLCMCRARRGISVTSRRHKNENSQSIFHARYRFSSPVDSCHSVVCTCAVVALNRGPAPRTWQLTCIRCHRSAWTFQGAKMCGGGRVIELLFRKFAVARNPRFPAERGGKRASAPMWMKDLSRESRGKAIAWSGERSTDQSWGRCVGVSGLGDQRPADLVVLQKKKKPSSCFFSSHKREKKVENKNMSSAWSAAKLGWRSRSASRKCIPFSCCFVEAKGKKIQRRRQKEPCRNPGLNQGPLDLQSNALPTELFRLLITDRMFLSFVKSHPFVESAEEYSILCVICLILSPNSRPTLSIATRPSSISKKKSFHVLSTVQESVCMSMKPENLMKQVYKALCDFWQKNNLYSNSLCCQENLTCNSVIACVGKFTLQSLLPQCMLKFTMRLMFWCLSSGQTNFQLGDFFGHRLSGCAAGITE